ncbi:MAG: GlsB/YeaQ/YmgE family stress response membrane protein [Gemmatimonadaceae bacterium]
MPLWLQWIVLGLLAGALAKFLVPGRDPAGCLVTIALGIAGAFIGGWIGTLVGWGRVTSPELHPRSVALATLGAIVVLLLGRLIFRRRGEDGVSRFS